MAEPPDMFDVAISFRAEDEAIASQLFERLRSRHRVFFYSRCQPEVAGEDGLEAYSAIFGKNARLVLVIFRNEWGTEKWTRIEATAIKNRTLNSGFDFLLFAPVDSNQAVPGLFPRPQIWYDIAQYGLADLIQTVENKLSKMNVAPHAETPAEYAARKEKKVLSAANLADLARTDGARLARDEIVRLIAMAKDKAPASVCNRPVKSLGHTEPMNIHFEVSCWGVIFAIDWVQQYSNSLLYSGLLAYVARRAVHRRDDEVIVEDRYEAELYEGPSVRWRRTGSDVVISSDAFVDQYMKRFVDDVCLAAAK